MALLLGRYSIFGKFARPTLSDGPIKVYIGIRLVQADVMEAQQVLSVTAWIQLVSTSNKMIYTI